MASSREKRKSVIGIEIIGDGSRKSSKPPSSQLGGLVRIFKYLGVNNEIVNTWFDNLNSTPNRSKKWPEGSIAKIRNLVTKPSEIWRVLEWHDPASLTTGAPEQLRRELWQEAVRLLIDAMVRAHRREIE